MSKLVSATIHIWKHTSEAHHKCYLVYALTSSRLNRKFEMRALPLVALIYLFSNAIPTSQTINCSRKVDERLKLRYATNDDAVYFAYKLRFYTERTCPLALEDPRSI